MLVGMGRNSWRGIFVGSSPPDGHPPDGAHVSSVFLRIFTYWSIWFAPPWAPLLGPHCLRRRIGSKGQTTNTAMYGVVWTWRLFDGPIWPMWAIHQILVYSSSQRKKKKYSKKKGGRACAHSLTHSLAFPPPP